MSNLILGPRSTFKHASVVCRDSGKIVATVEDSRIIFEDESLEKDVRRLLQFWGIPVTT